MKPLCIYHGGCDDGFAAAFIVRRALEADSVDFHPGVYDHAPPDVIGRHVIMVDFSYKAPVIRQMAERAKSILILDHHKTARIELSDLPEPPPFPEWCREAWQYGGGIGALSDLTAVQRNISLGGRMGPAVAALFDMERSGTGLAWDYFIGGGERPLWVTYIQDRDLWLKKVPHGDEFTIALRSYPQEFETWSALFARDDLAQPMCNELIKAGRDIQRYYRLRVEEIKKTAYHAFIDSRGEPTSSAPTSFGTWDCWIANAPYFVASEVAGELSERGGQFGACYFEASPGRWQYSLRSRGDFDVSAVARAFGGGGHRNAAGFTVAGPVHIPEAKL